MGCNQCVALVKIAVMSEGVIYMDGGGASSSWRARARWQHQFMHASSNGGHREDGVRTGSLGAAIPEYRNHVAAASKLIKTKLVPFVVHLLPAQQVMKKAGKQQDLIAEV
jgi:hypothetical protein